MERAGPEGLRRGTIVELGELLTALGITRVGASPESGQTAECRRVVLYRAIQRKNASRQARGPS